MLIHLNEHSSVCGSLVRLLHFLGRLAVGLGHVNERIKTGMMTTHLCGCFLSLLAGLLVFLVLILLLLTLVVRLRFELVIPFFFFLAFHLHVAILFLHLLFFLDFLFTTTLFFVIFIVFILRLFVF